MRKFILTLIVLFAALGMQAQSQTAINKAIFDKVYTQVKPVASYPMGDLVIEIAKQFLGTDYVAGTLEVEPEALQVFLDQTDCILFVEMCTCFALTVKGVEIVQAGDGIHFFERSEPSLKEAKPSYELLCRNIQNMRYRLGEIDGYASRIHYTSEWLLQNETNGLLKEFSSELGDEFTQHFSFMSTHPNNYKQIKNDPSQLKKISAMEKHLEAQKPYFYISQAQLKDPKIMSQIHSGDIITFISKAEGLDLAHVALAYEHNGEMHFIHASMKAMKVIIEPKTLADYATNGLRISRLADLTDLCGNICCTAPEL